MTDEKKAPDEEAQEQVRDLLGDDPPPKKVVDAMTANQIDDLMVGATERTLPDSVMERAWDAMTTRAKEEGYESLEAYMEAHPDGMSLLHAPLTIKLNDDEIDALRAEDALHREDDQSTHDEMMGFYHALVVLYMALNTRGGDLVETHPDLMRGKPCVQGSRVPIDMIVATLGEEQEDGSYRTVKDIAEDYDLPLEQVCDALQFASHCVRPRLMAEAMLMLSTEEGEDDA